VLEQAFTAWGTPVTWLELVAFVMALAMVLLNMRVHPGAWPLAIGSSLLYAWLFEASRLYGEAALQIVFALLGAWGWWQWLRGTQDGGAPLRVRSLPRRTALGALLAFALLWPAIGLALARLTDSPVPWWDALATAGSLVGQWLLGRKYIENWPAWVAVNAVSVALFASRGLVLTTVLYAIFLGLSFVGWRAWRRLAAAR
jgi:nicotinamide mononucleotide transporter